MLALSVCKIPFDNGIVDPQLTQSVTVFTVVGRDPRCGVTLRPMHCKNLNA